MYWYVCTYVQFSLDVHLIQHMVELLKATSRMQTKATLPMGLFKHPGLAHIPTFRGNFLDNPVALTSVSALSPLETSKHLCLNNCIECQLFPFQLWAPSLARRKRMYKSSLTNPSILRMEQFVVKQDEKEMSHLARTPDDVIFGEGADTCLCCLGSSRYFDKIWVRKRLHTSNKSKWQIRSHNNSLVGLDLS